MDAIELAETSWGDYLDTLSLSVAGAPATVQAAPAGITRPALSAIGRPLRRIGYDRRRDLLELATGGAGTTGPALRCFVSAPRRILATDTRQARSILVIDASGARTLIRISRPRRPRPRA